MATPPSNLPQQIIALIDIVGVTAALGLVRAYGGIIIVVPTGEKRAGNLRAGLVECMGETAALTFMQHYGKERMAVPRCYQALLDERDTRIIGMYERDRVPPQSIALQMGLTERQIRRILKRTPGASHGLTNERNELQLPLAL